MPSPKQPEPLLRTPDDQLGGDEHFKINSKGVVGPLPGAYRDLTSADIEKEAEFLSKSHGIYMEYNRAKTGREKDWMYMVRCSIPGGGSFTREQWQTFNDIADQHAAGNPYGPPSIRLTTRQNIQYHWVTKEHILPLVQAVASTGYYTLNGCGDNVRNVMGCPLSRYSSVYDANAKAHEYGTYFRIPSAPHIQVFAVDPTHIRDPEEQYEYGAKLLNRKFKIAFSAVHRDPVTGVLEHDNCVEALTNDLAVVPILEGEKVVAYQTWIGGGQGEKNGKPTFATLGKPLGILTEDNLMAGLKGIVDVHKEWGDRKNRHWARLKYVVQKQGIAWYREQLKGLGIDIAEPREDVTPGKRLMHHGWSKLETTGKWAFGAYIECGRLVDSTDAAGDPEHKSGNVQGNGNLRSMVPGVLEKFDGVEVMITANQDLLFTNIDDAARDDFEAALAEYGYGERKGRKYSTLRVLSGACVGLPTCRLSYTDSEQFEPELMDQLEDMGYGDMRESIGITGCERQCFRPATKTLGWVGQGPNMYMLKLGGSEDGSTQGTALVKDEKLYLRQVGREDVPQVCAVLFDNYLAHRESEDETMGAFHQRVGASALLDVIASDERTAHLMEKTAKAPYLPEGAFGAMDCAGAT